MSTAAQEAKAEGMALGDLPDKGGVWRATLLEAVYQVCLSQSFFTADDTYELVKGEANAAPRIVASRRTVKVAT